MKIELDVLLNSEHFDNVLLEYEAYIYVRDFIMGETDIRTHAAVAVENGAFDEPAMTVEMVKGLRFLTKRPGKS